MPDWSDPKFRKAAGEVLIDWLLIAFFIGLVIGCALEITSR